MPTPKRVKVEERTEAPATGAGISFYGALEHGVMKGYPVTKAEWNNPEVRGFLRGGELHITLADGKTHRWIVSESDMMGQDWRIIRPN